MKLRTARGWLWRAYFQPRRWEKSGEIYEAVGVRQIKELLFGGRYFNTLVSMLQGRKYRPFEGNAWLQRWLRFTVVVEAGHLSIGAYMLALSVEAVSQGDGLSAARILVINTLVNLYPVLVQRYNRGRILKIIDRTVPVSKG